MSITTTRGLGSAVRRVAIAVPAAVVLLASASAILPAVSYAASATGKVNTSGINLNVRATPSTGGTVVGSLADGASITIDCQTYGSTVSGTYGTTNIWDHVPAKGGYVSDTYVYTGSDTLVAPLCGGTTQESCKNSFGNPNSCSAAVTWAKNHETTTYHSDYAGRCDHVMALAYGWSASGSTTAHAHWLAIPAADKHPGDSNVPAGGLAFFSGGSSGAGHVMISIGGGNFVSTDIHGSGTLGVTTIATIKNTWGETYSGWAQPWFQINH
ncbi:MAG: hypothetical protein ABI140_14100 [Jatrophihabitantaceae bacterium]